MQLQIRRIGIANAGTAKLEGIGVHYSPPLVSGQSAERLHEADCCEPTDACPPQFTLREGPLGEWHSSESRSSAAVHTFVTANRMNE